MKRISNINIRSKFKKDSKQRIDLDIRNEQSCSVNVTKLHIFAQVKGQTRSGYLMLNLTKRLIV